MSDNVQTHTKFKELLKERCIEYDDSLNECDHMCEVLSNKQKQYYTCCGMCTKRHDCPKACPLAKQLRAEQGGL